jgi:hypothetical protein
MNTRAPFCVFLIPVGAVGGLWSELRKIHHKAPSKERALFGYCQSP